VNGTMAYSVDTKKLMIFNNTSGIPQWSEYNSEDE